ncbi:B-cell receptor CD22-like [Salmo trutta]|uniref:B-cell receptor CD22-like n=1 Tax=Salmo trutta TaxID=8032 RepID=UPI0011307A43|nr:B-cell receptor CD22-like [Salmo trutta]
MALRTAGSVLVVFLWSVAVVLGQYGWSVTYTTQSICTLEGSTVELSCSIEYPRGYTVTTTFWFTKYDAEGPVSLSDDPDYKGRVTYRKDKENGHTLSITDLRESDSATYKFRFIDQTGKWRYTGNPGVTLSVTGTVTFNIVKLLNSIYTKTQSPDNHSYIWYKNGQRLIRHETKYLYLKPVSSEDTGRYSCAVENHEDLPSAEETLTVRYGPKNTTVSPCPCLWVGYVTMDLTEKHMLDLFKTCGYMCGEIESIRLLHERLCAFVNIKNTNMAARALERLQALRTAGSVLMVFLWSVAVVLGQNGWSVTYTTQSICTLKGSTVELSWSIRYPSGTVTSTYWFTKWGTGVEPEDLSQNPEYAGRLEYHGDKKNDCTLRITDLRERDSATYKFRLIIDQTGWRYTGDPGVTLSVTVLQVKVTFSTWPNLVIITCITTCTLTGNPTYIWYKNGQHLDESTSPQYKDSVSSNYVDSYSCAVKSHEDLHSPAVCVQGQICYRVTYTKRRICVLKGSTVDISCTYVGYYSPTSTFWFRSDKSTPEDLTRDPGYTGRVKYTGTYRGPFILRITDLREEDSAEYRFTFKTDNFEWGHSFPGTTLSVTGLQVKVTPAAEGQKTLTCSTTCTLTDNPTYIWYRNGLNVQDTSSPMYSISSEDADSYSCAVKGREGLRSPAVCEYTSDKPKKTSVSVSPSGEIVEDSSVTLTCSSDANPPVDKYTWYKKNGGDYQSMTGPHHVFNQIQSSDSGEYYCEAQNEMGTDRSRTINMDVKYGPKSTSVSVSPSGEIVEGSSVTLTCSSDANPPVDKYTWYKKNGASMTGSEKTYNFTTISSEDSGEYYCEAENKYGHLNSSSVSVDVQYAPKNTSVSVSPSGERVEDSSVTLTCSSDANPPVDKYTWYFQNKTFLNGFGQMYNISKFKSKDNGHYHCEAWNGRGSRNSTALMIILPGKQTSVLNAAVGIIVVVLVLILCLSGLMWFRKKSSISSSDTRDTSETVQGDSSPVYENVSSMAMTPTAAQTAATVVQDDVHYASVHFSRFKNQEVPLYSTVQLHQPQKQEEDVQYDAVKFNLPSAANHSFICCCLLDEKTMMSLISERVDP